MKIVFKIFKIVTILIFAILVFLFSAARLLQDKVADIFLISLNNNISTKLQTGTFRLSFLSKFPKASLELRDVLVRSSSGFDTAAFPGINTDTLLAARNISIEFKITDILKGNYTIERIRAKCGKVNFYTDTEGLVNYDISFKNNKPGKEDFTLDLKKIYLSNIRTSYHNRATKLKINGLVNQGTLRSRIHGDNFGFSATGEVTIDSLQLYDTRINRTIISEIDVDLQKSKSGITIRKGNLHIDDYDFGLDGFISSDEIYDLKITGRNVDISKIRKYMPDKYSAIVSEYDPKGMLMVECSLKGHMNRTSNPHVEINWRMKDGHIGYGKSDLSLNNLSFEGFYSNGSKNRPATGTLKIKNFIANLGSAQYRGSLYVSDFDDPDAELALQGRVIPSEIKEFFGLKNISDTGGSIEFDIKLAGRPDFKKKLGLSYIADLKSEGILTFNSLSLGLNNSIIIISDVNGSILISDTFQAKGIKFNYRGQRISVDGEFRDLLQWLAGRPVPLIASADVSFDKFIPEAFSDMSHLTESPEINKSVFKLPDNLVLDINFRIDSLTYKTFSSSKISGTLNYRPKLLTFKSFNMNALKGTISGNGLILQNHNKTVLSKGIFNVSRVDVNRAFESFQNFGQSFLVAENIAGSLSGTFSLLLPLDSLLTPLITSLAAEGKYVLSDGALINFEPVKQLSSYIELSELENIHFEQMQNDFFIRNNYLYIPQMEVRSSAVDLSVNGKHSLDNDYEYHVKVLLSEILSKKRKRNKTTVTEFGVVEDDGLGRTSMMLKIIGKGEDVDVSYDMKAAATEIKNDIKSEKKSLKTILNQEYGWFKNDSAEMQKPAEKKPKVKVVWEDK
jgi:hypothetical protein